MKQDKQAEIDKQQRLTDKAGVEGADINGYQLDHREFEETKKALERLSSVQMGWYRNNGSLHLFLFPSAYNHIPDQQGVVIDPDDLWFTALTGDKAIVTGHWPVVCHIEPWVEDQWPEVIWHPYPFKGTVTKESFEPRRRLKKETFETSAEVLPDKMWRPLISTAATIVADLSVSHEFPDAPWPKPINTGEFTEAMGKWMKKWR